MIASILIIDVVWLTSTLGIEATSIENNSKSISNMCTEYLTTRRRVIVSASTTTNLQPILPMFKGERYEFWSIRVKMVLRSQDLWDLVSKGFLKEGNDAEVQENQEKDARSLAHIQQVVHDNIFSRIAASSTTKNAWMFCRPSTKGTLNLPTKWDHVVASIEESKDLTTLTFDQLMGSLHSHEALVNMNFECVEDERAFQVKDGESIFGRGRGHFSGRGGHGRGRGSSFGRGKGSVQCYNCNRFGHYRSECFPEPQANAVVEQDDDEDEC
ncbi:hypothetical protein E3N88_38341 [Mikania micrantha]|uniref:CCHC-type domain-containing protein n=1 Tax=Mikania micrantha TaxID=192012 RepID=A0A5N6LTR8_9ASTR|nr:hypothetical protein E3N88_38341 [Mikania micrantha]